MFKANKKDIKLKRGHTFEEYIVRLNAMSATINEICKYLKISPDELRNIYDGVYNLPLEKIGAVKKPKLETIPTGTDWSKGARA